MIKGEGNIVEVKRDVEIFWYLKDVKEIFEKIKFEELLYFWILFQNESRFNSY